MNGIRKFFLLSYISIASFSAAIVTPALPSMQSYFHLSGSRINFVVTVFLIGYMLGQLLYGPIANRYGRLNALISGLVINIVGIVICMIGNDIGSFDCLLLGRVITALGAASGLCCTFMLINALMPEKEAKQAFSLSVLSFMLGMGLAVLLGGLITEYGDWRQCFRLLLLHGAIMLASTRLFKDAAYKVKPIHIMSIWHSYVHALKNKNLLIYGIVLGSCPMTSYTYSSAAPFITQQFFALSPSAYGYWNLLTMVGMLAGSLGSAVAMQRYRMDRILLWALIALGVCMGSMWWMAWLQSSSALWFFVSMTAVYGCGGFIFPCASYLASHTIKDSASAASMMNFISIAMGMLSVMAMSFLPGNHFWAFNYAWLIYAVLIFVLWGFRNKAVSLTVVR